MSSNDVDQLLKDAANKNTRKKTDSDIRQLRNFIADNFPEHEETELGLIDTTALCEVLCQFFKAVKKTDGSDYEPATLRGIVASIDRYMLANSGSRISTAKQFRKVREVVKIKMKALNRSGRGTLPNQACPLSHQEVERLWSSGQLGADNPRSMINTLWWFNTTHFGMSSVTPHRQMCWGDLSLNAGDGRNGRRFLSFKPRAGVNVTKDAVEKSTAYENVNDPQRCPVELYVKYASLRPEKSLGVDAPFYLACNMRVSGSQPGEAWFKNQPIGVNTIGRIMKNMATAAQLGEGKRISNHSARKTSLQKLLY